MIQYFYLLFVYASLLPLNSFELDKQSDNILFIGHAYGSPLFDDEKMDLSVINFLKNNSTKKYKFIVWGGDFIDNCNNSNEVKNFYNSIPLEVFEKSIFIWGNHELKCYDNDVLAFVRKDENKVINLHGFDIYFLNTNLDSISNTYPILKQINTSKKKILFTHQVIFSKSNWILRTNSRDFYDQANLFFDKINLDKDLTIVTGDVGAIKGTPSLSYYKKNDANLLSSGLGNGNQNFAIEIELNPQEIKFYKLNLDNNESKLLTPSFYPITIYNFIYYFFLSKKRALIFFLILGFIISFKKINYFTKNILK